MPALNSSSRRPKALPAKRALRRPPPVDAGSTIAAVAPGAAFDPLAYDGGVHWLQQQGLQAIGHFAGDAALYYAASLDDRANAFCAAMAAAPAAVWAARGGSGSAQLLPRVAALSLQALSAHAPWLVGFSDITSLHARWQAAGWQSVHGANVTSIGSWEEGAMAELLALMGPRPPVADYVGARAEQGAGATGGDGAEGVLVGGNLTVLASLAGTGALPDWRGCVVLLEDIGEADYRLDRCFHQLQQARQFAGAAGFALGQFTASGAAPGTGVPPLLAASVQALGLPYVSGLPLGHDPSSRAVLLGGWARLEPSQARLQVVPT